MTVTAKNFTGEFSGEFMPPFKPKPRQPSMSKAELRAQGVLALAQASKPVMKLPMKIKRQCARCDHFNSVLVEPGEAVPAFKCLACGYSMARPQQLKVRRLREGVSSDAYTPLSLPPALETLPAVRSARVIASN